MPIVNHVVLASGAVVAVSVAVATAMAIYESPDLRRYADDVRRRIAIALQSLTDGIEGPQREPRFNRPEDADGFILSSRGPGAEHGGVEGDDESLRRQREELLYWNSVRLEKQKREEAPRAAQDESGELGSYVFNTGADVRDAPPGLRRRADAAPQPAMASSLYANPFADEHCISNDELSGLDTGIAPPPWEGSDIYSATTRDADDFKSATLEPSPAPAQDAALVEAPSQPEPSRPADTLERVLSDDEFMSAGQDDRSEAYASIQAWAQDSSRNFYSPLPVTPAAPVSEPELISEGQLTPTDSVSVIGSGEDLGRESRSSVAAGDTGRPFDVLSESEGMLTPVSWSEVGSVVSENEVVGPTPA
ncbi:hypothetical protein CDD83_777 [Cordyceps sp. RAO-2017]|nr:hypothetical protein CDD83_777 [Cordyceps sp. RAO-2017]